MKKKISHYDKKTTVKKYLAKYQKDFSSNNTALFIDNISKIRQKTLRNFIILRFEQNEALHNGNFDIYSLEFIQNVLNCNKATAYDYLRCFVALSVINDMGLIELKNAMKLISS